MERPLLEQAQLSETALKQVAQFHRQIVDHVAETIRNHAVVVVGMKQNPFVKRARKTLDSAGVRYEYLEYGSYLSQWKQRLAIKLWAGFPTFPMVFVNGKLIGGASELEDLSSQGKLPKIN